MHGHHLVHRFIIGATGKSIGATVYVPLLASQLAHLIL